MSDHFNRIQLADYVLGRTSSTVNAQIASHIKHCVECHTVLLEIQDAREFLGRFAESVRPTEHPEPEQVVRFLRNELSEEKAEPIRRHLMVCESCWLSDAVVEDTLKFSREEKDFLERNFPIGGTLEFVKSALLHQKSISGESRVHHQQFTDLLSQTAMFLKELGRDLVEFVTEPIRLPGLIPVMAAAEFAAPEGGFEEQKIQAEGSPFVLTFYRIGQRHRIHVKTDDPEYDNCLVAVRLLEGQVERGAVLILVRNGEGEHELGDEERALFQPLRKDCEVRHQVLWPVTELSHDEQSLVAESFKGLLMVTTGEIRSYLLQVLSELGMGPEEEDA